ncbi:hypothetical protein [Erwinia tasmaniensis]|uniref:hypothetical protein n=1 Tax=Erwinia tasmaniensis TaxID=338565 RepID=UPI003A4D51D9
MSVNSINSSILSNFICQVASNRNVSETSKKTFIKNISRISQSPEKMTSLTRRIKNHFELKNDSIEKHGASINKFYRNELIKEDLSPSKNTALHQIARSQVLAANSKFSGSHVKLAFEKYHGVSMVDTRPNLPTRNKT